MLATVFLPMADARARDLDARQLRRAAVERVGRHREAGRDDAARVLAARRDDIEGGGGAEVDDDGPLGPARVRRDGVDDAIGARPRAGCRTGSACRS